jgi:nucleotide-binding universal stress UspA family protein
LCAAACEFINPGVVIMLKILVPTDGSDAALRAVRYVSDLAASGIEITIHLLNVQPPLPQSVTDFVPASSVATYHEDEGNKALADAAALLAERGIAFERHLEVGRADERIAQSAIELGCDQIVMGTHGLGAVAGLLLGSTSTKLLHLTSVPVTLIK